jgi:hypothetical protein
MHFCAAPVCQARVGPRHVMCPDHWQALPLALRVQFVRSYIRRPDGSPQPTATWRRLLREAAFVFYQRGGFPLGAAR